MSLGPLMIDLVGTSVAGKYDVEEVVAKTVLSVIYRATHHARAVADYQPMPAAPAPVAGPDPAVMAQLRGSVLLAPGLLAASVALGLCVGRGLWSWLEQVRSAAR